jgi:hypothetical protein
LIRFPYFVSVLIGDGERDEQKEVSEQKNGGGSPSAQEDAKEGDGRNRGTPTIVSDAFSGEFERFVFFFFFRLRF